MPQTMTDRSLLVDNLFAAKRMKQQKMAEMEMKKKKKMRADMAKRTKIKKKVIKVNVGRVNRDLFGGMFR